MISLRDVWYRYRGSSGWALRGVNACFGGGVTAVVGPNGSGKTTLLKVSSLIYRPSKGTVHIGGKDFWGIDDPGERTEIRRCAVYVHERPILVRGTALYNVAYGLTIRGYKLSDALRIASEIMDSLGVGYLKGKDRRGLSAGEAQLVSIMRAVAVRPRYLFLDEPVAHLDLEKRRVLISLVRKEASRGVACVIATHDYHLATTLADRVIVMEDGRVAVEGPPEEVL